MKTSRRTIIYVAITLRVMSRSLHKALASVRLVTRSVTATYLLLDRDYGRSVSSLTTFCSGFESDASAFGLKWASI